MDHGDEPDVLDLAGQLRGVQVLVTSSPGKIGRSPFRMSALTAEPDYSPADASTGCSMNFQRPAFAAPGTLASLAACSDRCSARNWASSI